MSLQFFNKWLLATCFLVLIYNCSSDDSFSEVENLVIDNLTRGAGVFNFNYNQSNLNLTIKVFYYIPENKTATTQILFVFHGAGRNARDYRDAVQAKAEQFGVIVLAPEFSIQNFPSGDQYNLGNVFVDGDNPSPSTLNPENEWTFSIIEPLFDFVKTQIDNSNNTYNVIGHSAGAQFAHRLMMFKPNVRINKAVISAAGWYTVPNTAIRFPYGFMDSPLEDLSLTNLFQKTIYIQVGENDNNPNASGLRRNEFVDAQGTNRKDRAIHFFEFSETLAQSNQFTFNWNFILIPNADHNFMVATQNGIDLLYN